MTGDERVRLDYAPAPRRGRVRRLLVVALSAAVIVTAIHFGPRLARHAELLRLQSQCRGYVLPVDGVVVDSKSAAAPIALPNCWTAYRAMVPAVRTWQGGRPGSLVLLHELQTPKGERRIVAMYADADGETVVLHVIKPAGWFSPPVEVENYLSYGFTADWLKWGRDGHRMRVFAGQMDPEDPSHFTIRYEFDNVPGVIDGHLQEDFTVLQARSGALMLR